MARAGVLPQWLGPIRPVNPTPSRAVIVQTSLALAVWLGAGSLVAPDQAFFMLGTVGTIVYVFVYLMGNIGVARFFLTRQRRELNVLIHLVFPAISTVALLLGLYYSLVPLPDPQVSYAPEIALVLFVTGLLVLWRLQVSADTRWKKLSQEVVTPAEPIAETSSPRGATI